MPCAVLMSIPYAPSVGQAPGALPVAFVIETVAKFEFATEIETTVPC